MVGNTYTTCGLTSRFSGAPLRRRPARIRLSVSALVLSLCLSPSAVAQVARVGAWTTGLPHTVGAGSDRLLVFMVGYEDGGNNDPLITAFARAVAKSDKKSLSLKLEDDLKTKLKRVYKIRKEWTDRNSTMIRNTKPVNPGYARLDAFSA